MPATARALYCVLQLCEQTGSVVVVAQQHNPTHEESSALCPATRPATILSCLQLFAVPKAAFFCFVLDFRKSMSVGLDWTGGLCSFNRDLCSNPSVIQN